MPTPENQNSLSSPEPIVDTNTEQLSDEITGEIDTSEASTSEVALRISLLGKLIIPPPTPSYQAEGA